MIVSRIERERVAKYLMSLLPAHVFARDHESGGLLSALLDAVGGELSMLEHDLDQLYDAWFVETCPEWVVPYLADLVGLVGLPGDLDVGAGAALSRRAVVANTIGYRQRKGTVAVVEQVVRDVTGWPSRAVEFYQLLATTTHINHARLDRPAFASVRHADRAELESPNLASGALTSFAHLGEARRIASGRGRYLISNIGVFVFPVQVYDAADTPARRVNDWWSCHPLGWDQPVFAVTATESSIEHLATEPDLPVPLRPRRLLAALEAARIGRPGEPVHVSVRVDADPALPPDRVRVCGLESLATDAVGDPLPGAQVMVDTVRGRLYPYRDGVPDAPAHLHLDYAYAACADIGAGTYNRSLAHHDALIADPFTGDLDRGGDHIGAQTHVRSRPPLPGVETSLLDGVAKIAAAWAARDLVGGTQVLSVGDSEVYPGDLALEVPAESRLTVVAAHWSGRLQLDGDIEAPVPGIYSPEGLRPRVDGDIHITGEAGSSLVLDGLIVDGDVIVEPGSIRSLIVSQCTISGHVLVRGTTLAGNRELSVFCWRSEIGGIDVAATVPTAIVTDSVVDPALRRTPGFAIQAPNANLTIIGSTLFGEIDCRTLDVTSSICDGTVTVVDRQVGCARFSYLTSGSRVPRRFRCVPPIDSEVGDAPSYVANTPGSPFYPNLAPSAPTSITRGGEFGAEMGVHHHLRRPPRIDAARRLVAPYVPAGIQFGMFGG